MPLFVHIGDAHLQHGHPRNPDRLQALDQIIDENVTRPDLGAWLVPGDLFHQRSTAEDRNALAERLVRMADAAPVVIVRGNHDQPGDLDLFARLQARWPIVVVTRPQVLRVELPTSDVAAIACLPYPDKFGLVTAGVLPADVPRTATDLLDVICMELADALSPLRIGLAIPLAIGHANVRGAIASTGQPQIGHEPEFDAMSLARLPVLYWGFSHIHKPQHVGCVTYAGSIAAMDYGETEAKSYVRVVVARINGAWTPAVERRPILTPPMHHIEGRLTRDGFRLKEHPDVPLEYRAGAWTGADVRVRFEYLASEKAVIDDRCIRELFKDAMRLKVEGLAIPDRELRAPEVAAAKTLPEKIAAYRQVAALDSSVAEKLSQLQSMDADTVLRVVAETLAQLEQSRADAMVAA